MKPAPLQGPEGTIALPLETFRRLERLAAFGELAAGLTHEVKNPITVIIGFAQIAQRKADEPDQVQRLLSLIEQEGLRCKELLLDFLRLASVPAASAAGFEALDLNAWLRSLAPRIAHQLASQELRLELELADDLPPIRGNPRDLGQVMLNLALNAQRAMRAGGVLRISTARSGAGGLLIVADDGAGMPEGVQARIFEPFFTTHAESGGTGLGLALCARIVAEHGGSIAVESAEGAGTTFRIQLCAAPPAGEGP